MKFLYKNMLKNKKSQYLLIFFVVLFLVAVYLRYTHFNARIALGEDVSRDITIAQVALQYHQLPLIGSFSSAGPFVFGPIFIWFIMLSYLILPFTFYAPYILTGVVSLATIGILSYIAYLLGGKKMALVAAIVTTFSPQLVLRSVALTQHTFVSATSTLVILFYVLLWLRKNMWYAFLLGLSIGAGISFHYQAINLLIFLPALFFVDTISWKKRILAFFYCLLGIALALLPLFIWDAQQSFANIRNIMDYFLIAQYRIYVPNSWKLFLFDYLPAFWSFVVGGWVWLAAVDIIFCYVLAVKAIYAKILPKILVVLFGILSLLLLLNRFYRGERSEGYLLYFDPFMILFTSWAIVYFYTTFAKKKYLRIVAILCGLFLFSLVIGDLFRFLPFPAKNLPWEQAVQAKNTLEREFPTSQFSLYDYRLKTVDQAETLTVLLHQDQRTSMNGLSIGIINPGELPASESGVIITQNIVNLSNIDNLNKNKVWINLNPESIYAGLIGWSNTHSLKASFNLISYIRSVFHL